MKLNIALDLEWTGRLSLGIGQRRLLIVVQDRGFAPVFQKTEALIQQVPIKGTYGQNLRMPIVQDDPIRSWNLRRREAFHPGAATIRIRQQVSSAPQNVSLRKRQAMKFSISLGNNGTQRNPLVKPILPYTRPALGRQLIEFRQDDLGDEISPWCHWEACSGVIASFFNEECQHAMKLRIEESPRS